MRINKEEKEFLLKKYLEEVLNNIQEIQNRLGELDENNYKEQINLRGKLISLLDDAIKFTKDRTDKNKLKEEKLNELKKHKEMIKNYKKEDNEKIPIPEKLALDIKDISDSIKIFMTEKDVIKKFQNIIKETATGTVASAVITAATCLILYKFLGIPLMIASLSELLPIVGYVGLSSTIRNIFSKTSFEQYLEQQSPEFKKAIEEFMEKNKSKIEEIGKKASNKNDATELDKIKINEELIKDLDSIARSSDILGVRNVYQLQALGFLRENKELCEIIKDEYLDEKNDNKELYRIVNEKLMKINLEIFARENSLEEATKFAAKNTVKNMAIITAVKLILSHVAPATFPFESIKNLVVPFAFAAVNGIINVPTYTNKLKYKETDYQGKVRMKNKERIDEILGKNRSVSVIA